MRTLTLKGNLKICLSNVFLNEPVPGSFCFIFVLFPHNSNIIWKKRRWRAWDSNPGLQDDGRRLAVASQTSLHNFDDFWINGEIRQNFADLWTLEITVPNILSPASLRQTKRTTPQLLLLCFKGKLKNIVV